MAATVRSETALKKDVKKKLVNAQDPLEKLRLQCLARGCNGIKSLGRMFRIIDDDGNRKLDFNEFKKGLSDYGAGVNNDEAKTIFTNLDRDSSGVIDFDEFLIALRVSLHNEQKPMHILRLVCAGSARYAACYIVTPSIGSQPPMSQSRQTVIMQAFRKLDKNGDGVVTVDDMKGLYNAKNNPKYLSGEMTEDQLFKVYLETFEMSSHPDGMVTKDEFINYYAGVSASIDNDMYFDLMMRNAWKL